MTDSEGLLVIGDCAHVIPGVSRVGEREIKLTCSQHMQGNLGWIKQLKNPSLFELSYK